MLTKLNSSKDIRSLQFKCYYTKSLTILKYSVHWVLVNVTVQFYVFTRTAFWKLIISAFAFTGFHFSFRHSSNHVIHISENSALTSLVLLREKLATVSNVASMLLLLKSATLSPTTTNMQRLWYFCCHIKEHYFWKASHSPYHLLCRPSESTSYFIIIMVWRQCRYHCEENSSVFSLIRMHASSKTLHQQNRPVLNWRCQLMQVDM